MQYAWDGIFTQLKQFQKMFEQADKEKNWPLLACLHRAVAKFGQDLANLGNREAENLTEGIVARLNEQFSVRSARAQKKT